MPTKTRTRKTRPIAVLRKVMCRQSGCYAHFTDVPREIVTEGRVLACRAHITSVCYSPDEVNALLAANPGMRFHHDTRFSVTRPVAPQPASDPTDDEHFCGAPTKSGEPCRNKLGNCRFH